MMESNWEKTPQILIVDDQQANCLLLAEIMAGVCPGADIKTFLNPLDALQHASIADVDLLITDYHMRELDGISLIRQIRALQHLHDPPIICVTSSDDIDVRYAALDAGANDYLSRPLDYRECAARCRNLLNMRQLQLAMLSHAQNLSKKILEVTRKLETKNMETLFRLAKVAEQRDTDTGAHLQRIGKFSAYLARKLGCDDHFCSIIELAAPLHDLGKVAIPDDILLARRPLTPAEWDIMKTHTTIGHAMLAGSDSVPMQLAADIARSHHERFDGSGYPDGLVGEQIPLAARILAVADVYDALTSKRPYKEAWPHERACAYLTEQAGKHLDPKLVTAFLASAEDILQISGIRLH